MGIAAAVLVAGGGLYLTAGRHGMNQPSHQVSASVAGSSKQQHATAPSSSSSSRNANMSLMLPVAGQVAAPYGWTYSSHLGEWYFNPGLTLASQPGQAVHAAWAGRVLSVVQKPMMGLTITMDNGGGVQTVYGHLGKALVAAGETVNQGAVIGTVGGPSVYSRDAAAHLDFQIWHGAVSVNPENYLKGSS
ncbi:MAG: peptidoglycan DD-metalloendopeptidase family protein [Clostridia bacterium]